MQPFREVSSANEKPRRLVRNLRELVELEAINCAVRSASTSSSASSSSCLTTWQAQGCRCVASQPVEQNPETCAKLGELLQGARILQLAAALYLCATCRRLSLPQRRRQRVAQATSCCWHHSLLEAAASATKTNKSDLNAKQRDDAADLRRRRRTLFRNTSYFLKKTIPVCFMNTP